jgi:hypothetical protein
MSAKIGIYITGLGQSFHKESIEKYAVRIKNELSYTTTGVQYDIKSEKIMYTNSKESTCVSIEKKQNGITETLYKIYDFQYHSILTERFNQKNILTKSLILIALVVKKFPQLFIRMFKSDNFSRPYQTFYGFLILFIIALSILFLLPACIDLFFDVSIVAGIKDILKFLHVKEDYSNELGWIKDFGKDLVPVLTFILLIVPESKTILTSMATEFVCVDRYIRNGEQSQIVQGNLDLLIEYITEIEPGSKIHFHCYSFGCILAIDHLFSLGTEPNRNTIQSSELLITIGNPYEFVRAYYPPFFKRRCKIMDDKISWINIYSTADALATNFRRDSKRGEAQFGIIDNHLVPSNINFEVAYDRSIGLGFFSLYSISVHKRYWDSSPDGKNCMKPVLDYMLTKGYIQN